MKLLIQYHSTQRQDGYTKIVNTEFHINKLVTI